jgi:hypothetical protein
MYNYIMSKIKYTEEIIQKAITLKLQGLITSEIVAITGIKKPSLMKIFRDRNIKLTEEQSKINRDRRWADHDPLGDGEKECSTCHKMLALDNFHVSERRVSGRVSSCKYCSKQNYNDNAEKIKARVKKYKSENQELVKMWDRNRYIAKTQEYIDRAKEWATNNPEKAKESSLKYNRANQPKKNARTAKRRATKLQATPPWLSDQQISEIRRIYENCPVGYQVDHIVPLQGRNVRGLHVPWNLQYLPALENNKKGNRM